MAGFTPQPDEGYSEDPLTAPSAVASVLKPRDDALSALGSLRPGEEYPPWLIQHISGLSISRKTELVMAVLNDLPTSVVSQIVHNLYPRLYIDFVRYLPPEICLKILEHLDPLSLLNVARCCRAWYNLALDRKLWETLYYLEGWKAVPHEIAAAERERNGPLVDTSTRVSRRVHSQDHGHANKKRAISVSPTLDADADTIMADAGNTPRRESIDVQLAETSIFGGPKMPAPSGDSSQRPNYIEGQSGGLRTTDKGKGVDKGKGRADHPPQTAAHMQDPSLVAMTAPSRLARSGIWVWDVSSSSFKINWKHLYSMRRRLESNWERGKYVNFQFPHADHPEEGHGECIYSLQYNSQYLVSSSRDRTLKVWDMKTRRCLRTLAKHRGSVLCLQFDSDPEEDLIVSGSSDSDVIIWRFSTGKDLQILRHAHRESVLNVKFDKRILVTCSKDKTIRVFNRRPLRHGDLGYPEEVDPVPRVINYGYDIPMSPDALPVIPAWTMIGSLEGHNAAVNAVQIHDREVVSASGDRHIKVWDWPTQVCTRTIIGHNKGIACVQYDGRRIVSGSSDNEIKVFDRQTGLEVANLRSHSALVRTIQAGFGDLPNNSAEDDYSEARRVDMEFFKAVALGLVDDEPNGRSSRRTANAGSKRPEDVVAYGASLPPGGGGGKYGRIVSGSYDASIIIWRKDKEGIWKDQHRFKHEDAAIEAVEHDRTNPSLARHHSRARRRDVSLAPAGPSTAAPRRSQSASAPPESSTGASLPPLSAVLNQGDSPSAALQRLHQIIDDAVQGGPQSLAQAIAAFPAILTQRPAVEAAIERQQNPVARSRLHHQYSNALVQAQFDMARQRREIQRNQEAAAAGPSSAAASPGSAEGSGAGQQAARLNPAQQAAAAAHLAHAHVPLSGGSRQQVSAPAHAATTTTTATAAAAHQPQAQPQHHHQHHGHVANAPAPAADEQEPPPPRVFKLQYDARRIICCSQRSVIVGWDFCNGDQELEEASRFFAPVE
ncbi:hypothetical protein VTI74DRAFT_1281 [Chaetomium olivicolor]